MVSVIEKAGIDEAFMDVTDMAEARLAQMVRGLSCCYAWRLNLPLVMTVLLL